MGKVGKWRAGKYAGEATEVSRSKGRGCPKQSDLNGSRRASTISSPVLYLPGSVTGSLRSCRFQRAGNFQTKNPAEKRVFYLVAQTGFPWLASRAGIECFSKRF